MIELAEKKLQHPIHIKLKQPLFLAEMLAIILYTDTDAYKDLRKTELMGNYKKWHWFGLNLTSALRKLTYAE